MLHDPLVTENILSLPFTFPVKQVCLNNMKEQERDGIVVNCGCHQFADRPFRRCPCRDRSAVSISCAGVVAAIVPWNFPLMLLAWKVCPALAMGNTVVLKPATYTRLSALLFAEICAEAG